MAEKKRKSALDIFYSDFKSRYGKCDVIEQVPWLLRFVCHSYLNKGRPQKAYITLKMVFGRNVIELEYNHSEMRTTVSGHYYCGSQSNYSLGNYARLLTLCQGIIESGIMAKMYKARWPTIEEYGGVAEMRHFRHYEYAFSLFDKGNLYRIGHTPVTWG